MKKSQLLKYFFNTYNNNLTNNHLHVYFISETHQSLNRTTKRTSSCDCRWANEFGTFDGYQCGADASQ